MKKFLTAFLFVSSLALMGAAIACNGEDDAASSSSSSPTETQRRVSFETGEGYSFTSNAPNGNIAEGRLLTFAVDMGAFYTGSPIAYVNDEPVLADDSGIFTYAVGKENLVIRVEGVRKDVSMMSGSGTMEDAYVVSKPIDLLYIAEQINNGNRSYASAAYVLGNDIDCKGEELEIIGDYSTTDAYFSGVFSCVSDSDTGEITRHTISNFKIYSQDSNYVGLFGAIFADASVESSGLIYGIRLENFEIYAGINEMTQSNKSISCGSMLGYGVGANLTLCDAINGQINVAGDNNYFAYVGGLVGYQQGFYDTSYGRAYPSDVVYAAVDTDINIVGGLALYAGGVSGYMTSNYPINATASIHNCYSLGNVNGALRSGGIVGGMGTYTVVSNSYAVGDVVATASQDVTDPDSISTGEYAYAYAGGLVGYAENDSIAHDSFFVGDTAAFANSGVSYAFNSPTVGGGDPAGTVAVNGQKYIVKDCLFDDDVDNSNKNFFKNSVLGWTENDWTFKANTYPTINYTVASPSSDLTMTLNYIATDNPDAVVKMNEVSTYEMVFFNAAVQSSSYTPIGSWVSGANNVSLLAQYYTADDGDYLSYGFFFDEACTQRVPLSYTPEKSFTLYLAFANPEEILGTYNFFPKNSASAHTLEIKKDGTAVYTDGNTVHETLYAYDGSTLLLESVRLARYYDGEIVMDEDDTSVFYDTNFDLSRYYTYNFYGIFENDTIKLYDGKYFTFEAPLTAYGETYAGQTLRGEFYNATDSADKNTYVFYGNTAKVITKNGKSTEYGKVVLTSDTIQLFQGTEELPALELQRADLKQYDALKGSWTKSANVHKTYTFDGKGGWSYTHIAYIRSAEGDLNEKTLDSDFGAYDQNALTFTRGEKTMKAVREGNTLVVSQLNEEGDVITGTTEIYYASNGYKGVWNGTNYTLTLDGIANGAGYGYATVVDFQGFTTKLLYEESETTGILVFYYYTIPVVDKVQQPPMKSDFFGYASYNSYTNTLQFVSPLNASSSSSGYVADTLILHDNFTGTWITEIEGLDGVEMEFNGLGGYGYLGYNGTIVITNGSLTTVEKYTLVDSFIAEFYYNGNPYRVQFNELTGEVELVNDTDSVFRRQDEFGGLTLITDDEDNLICDIDGRSTLLGGGSFTFNGKNYKYFADNENGGYIVKNASDENVGTLKHVKTHYVLDLTGVASYDLYITNEFMGNWAISGEFDLLRVGPTDTDGVIRANFKGTPVQMTFLDPATLQFRYIGADKIPHNYYVYIIEDAATNGEVLVVSDSTSLAAGGYFICARANELFGTWWMDKQANESRPNEFTGKYFQFDGITSGYVNGSAKYVWQLDFATPSTDYYYTIKTFRGTQRILMWSKEPLANSTYYYRLDIYNSIASIPDGVEEYFTLEGANKYLVRTKVDGLYLSQAKDTETNDVYYFDYDLEQGSLIYVGDTAMYSYKILSYNTDNTVSLEITELGEDGMTFKATLDYKDSNNFLFSIGSPVVEA